jgi:hypothetical protein
MQENNGCGKVVYTGKVQEPDKVVKTICVWKRWIEVSLYKFGFWDTVSLCSEVFPTFQQTLLLPFYPEDSNCNVCQNGTSSTHDIAEP